MPHVTEDKSTLNKLILESASEGIYGLDNEGKTTFANPAACKMLGYTEEELIGQPMHALIHHSYLDGATYPLEKCHICSTYTHGQTKHIDDEALWRKDGTSFPVEYTSTPIQKDGQLSGTVIVFRDITSRMDIVKALNSSQKELAKQTEILQASLDAIDQGFAVWDGDKRLVAWNEKCKEFWHNPLQVKVGMKRQDLLRHITEKGVFGKGDAEKLVGEQLERLQELGSDSTEEFTTQEDRIVLVRRYPMPNEGYAAVYIDITERRRQVEILEEKVRERTKELHATNKDLESLSLETIRQLGRAGEYRDNETSMHVVRMSKSCQQLALATGIDEDRATLILNASPMHDVGKIGIPDNILLKPGKLTPEEFDIMKTHVNIGCDIIGEHEQEIMKLVRIIALNHHEKWDGSGYPQGLKGEEIPFEGRIAAICDVFDALTSERPYKKAWPLDQAITFINEQAGIHFDPDLIEKFNEIFPEILGIHDKYADSEDNG